jgi:fluoride exporter
MRVDGIIPVAQRGKTRYSPGNSSTVMNFMLVGVGGALGSMARHGVGMAIARATPANLTPYATMTVNLAGCLAIGVLAGLVASHRVVMGTGTRAFVFAGVLGGFTTFSSFGLDTFTLAHGGRAGVAAMNVAIQVAAGLALVAAGYAVAARVQ